MPGLFQIIILNQKDCLLFKGRQLKGEGYTWEEAMRFGNRLSGAATWEGKDVMIRAVPVTLAKAKVDIAKARQFIRTQNWKSWLYIDLRSRERRRKPGQWNHPLCRKPPMYRDGKRPLAELIDMQP